MLELPIRMTCEQLTAELSERLGCDPLELGLSSPLGTHTDGFRVVKLRNLSEASMGELQRTVEAMQCDLARRVAIVPRVDTTRETGQNEMDMPQILCEEAAPACADRSRHVEPFEWPRLPSNLLVFFLSLLDCRTLLLSVPAVCSHWRDACRLVTADLDLGWASTTQDGVLSSRLTDTAIASVAGTFRGATSVAMQNSVNVTDVGVQALVAACPSLSRLCLRGLDRITDASITALAGLRLSSLDLSFCFGVSGRAISQLIEACPQLADLALCGLAHVDDSTMVALRSPTLASLDLSWCSALTDVGLALLAGGCAQVSSLKLDFCYRLTDPGIEQLATLRRLEQLSLRGCDAIGDAGLAHLNGLHSLLSLNVAGCPGISNVAVGTFLSLRENIAMVPPG